MQTTPSWPHAFWSEVWLPILTAVLGASAATLRTWFNRKKPSEIDAANIKTRADARKTEAEALVLLTTNIAELNIEMLTRMEQHATDIEAIRKRVHNAVDEIQRCYAFIKSHEIKMAEAKLEFKPFDIKSYKDIIGE